MTAVRTFFLVIFPYMAITCFVVGHVWRYKYDKFGWTTRSSQWYENRLLRWASPMFHFGLLFVLLGHAVGLLVPQGWTDALGVSESVYHWNALIVGGIAAIVMVIGFVGLIWRRRTTPAVFRVTTKMDKAMYVVLGIVIVLGLVNTFYFQTIGTAGGAGYNYRESVAEWFRSIFYFNPKPELIEDAPWSFQLHAIAAFALIALWPFTRLVHVLSAPVWYLFRPYVVYRSKVPQPQAGNRAPRRGWEKSGLNTPVK
jgi:nitrate reductase gamma subunit